MIVAPDPPTGHGEEHRRRTWELSTCGFPWLWWRDRATQIKKETCFLLQNNSNAMFFWSWTTVRSRRLKRDTLMTRFLGGKCQWKMEDDPNMIIFTREDWSLQVPAGFYKTVRRRIPKFRNWKYIWYMLIQGGENHAAKLYLLLFLQSFYEFCHWGVFITRTWSPNSPMAYFIVKPKHSQRCFLT